MHILYLYDFTNTSFSNDDYNEIKENIKMFIDNLYLPKDFKKIIIQVAYFDIERNRNEKENKLKDEIKKLKENSHTKDDEIKKLKENNKSKDDEIKMLKENNKSKDDEIKKLKELLKQSMKK